VHLNITSWVNHYNLSIEKSFPLLVFLQSTANMVIKQIYTIRVLLHPKYTGRGHFPSAAGHALKVPLQLGFAKDTRNLRSSLHLSGEKATFFPPE
jgi:hypothetical protein